MTITLVTNLCYHVCAFVVKYWFVFLVVLITLCFHESLH
jgi:hypothetical protein